MVITVRESAVGQAAINAQGGSEVFVKDMRLKTNGKQMAKRSFLATKVKDLIDKQLHIPHQDFARDIVSFRHGINNLDVILALDQMIGKFGGSLIQMQDRRRVDDQNPFAIGLNTQMKAELVWRLGCGVISIKTRG